MAEPFIAEVRIFAGNFAPRGWAFADGGLFPISQNTALFSIVGTTFGGDGRTTFGVPDLRGRAPMHAGRGPGLTPRTLGQRSGSETVPLTANQLPVHKHTLRGTDDNRDATSPAGRLYARTPGEEQYKESPASGNEVLMNAGATGMAGSSSPEAHPNLQPLMVLNFIVALVGTYPSRS
jgi:microcystin-dependent protein